MWKNYFRNALVSKGWQRLTFAPLKKSNNNNKILILSIFLGLSANFLVLSLLGKKKLKVER